MIRWDTAWHIGLAILWVSTFSYFRYRAARAETPADKEWLRAFVGLGWAKARTVDGRKYGRYAWAALIIGAALFFLSPIHPFKR
jgi:hypothetical protein